MIRELRLGLRRLVAAPAFTAATIVSLGLGVGGATLVFGLASSLFLQPLPVRDPGSVVAVFTSDFGGEAHAASSYPDVVDLAAERAAFSDVVAYQPQPLSARRGSAPPGMMVVEAVTGNAFGALGLPVAQGRGLTPADDAPGAPAALVLSHEAWRSRFGADAGVVGSPIELSGRPATIVGVAAPGLRGLLRGVAFEGWVTLHVAAAVRTGDMLTGRGSRGLMVLARLAPGVGIEAAQARADVVAARLHAAWPDAWRTAAGAPRRITLVAEDGARVLPFLRLPLQAFLGLLLAATLSFLAVACANVAGLLLARGLARQRDTAVRVALGATRQDILREALAEALLIAALGGLLGVGLAHAGSGLWSAIRLPVPVPVRIDAPVDARALGFALALALLSAVAAGVAPALHAARVDAMAGLREAAAPGPTRLRRAFVVAQVAITAILVLGAGLIWRGVGHAAQLDPGFEVRHALLASLDVSLAGLDEAQGRAYQDRLLARVRALPGVEAASWSTNVPLGLDWMRRGLWVEGEPERPGDREVHAAIVGDGYFETLGVPIVRGRGIGVEPAPAAVVNETFARRHWPGVEPLGRRVSLSGPEGPWIEVVGVARDGAYQARGEQPKEFLFTAMAHDPASMATLLVRTAVEPRSLEASVRQAVAAEDPRVAVFAVTTLAEHVDVSLLPARLAGSLLLACGALGVGLATLGLHALLAFSVARRSRDLGVRLALGATRADIARLVVAEAVRLATLGSVLGLAAGLPLARLLGSLLHGIPPTDPLALAILVGILAAVTAVAAFVPARRAAGLDPAVALRAE